MKIRAKKNYNRESIRMSIEALYSATEEQIAGDGGTIYVVDGKHWYLWYANWLWDLQDKSEIGDLFDDHDFYRKPRWVPKANVIDTLCENLGRHLPMPTHKLSAPITRLPNTPIAEYRKDLQQHILKTYYPI